MRVIPTHRTWFALAAIAVPGMTIPAVGWLNSPAGGGVPLVVQETPSLQAVLTDGCDSRTFLAGVEAFMIADAIARTESPEVQEERYDAIIEREGAPALQTIFSIPTLLHLNEAHDCQRLVVDSMGVQIFGPLTGIFVDTLAVQRSAPNGRIMAEIYNFTGEPYDALMLQDSLHCLWMRGAGDDWEAWIFRPADPTDTCANLEPRDTQRVDQNSLLELTVTARSVLTGPPGRRLPNTARWMWDDAERLHYIAIRCGDFACELTPPGLTVEPGDVQTAPGWSDRQVLAVPREGDGVLIPSGLIGTIEPMQGVQHANYRDQVRDLIQRGRMGMPAARVTLDGNDDRARRAYAHKMDLNTKVNPNTDQSMDVIRLQVTVPTPGDTIWRGFTESRGAQDAHVLRPASNVPHSGLGTVRWRWTEKDEMGWIPCREGCCVYHEDTEFD